MKRSRPAKPPPKLFSADCATANIKLLLPTQEQDWSSYLQALQGIGLRPLKRTYTVREFRPQQNEFDVDFVLHDNPGPATRWALGAKVGDQIGIAGPGTLKRVNTNGDWFLLAGDATALPAISANLARLPENARGYAVIELVDSQDQQRLAMPAGIALRWLVNADPASTLLADTVMALPWLAGTPAVWVAGETTFVRKLRSYFVKDRQVPQAFRYTSGYWHLGHTEDSFQPIKRSEPFD